MTYKLVTLLQEALYEIGPLFLHVQAATQSVFGEPHVLLPGWQEPKLVEHKDPRWGDVHNQTPKKGALPEVGCYSLHPGVRARILETPEIRAKAEVPNYVEGGVVEPGLHVDCLPPAI